MKIKSIIAMSLCGIMVFSFVGCGNNNKSEGFDKYNSANPPVPSVKDNSNKNNNQSDFNKKVERFYVTRDEKGEKIELSTLNDMDKYSKRMEVNGIISGDQFEKVIFDPLSYKNYMFIDFPAKVAQIQSDNNITLLLLEISGEKYNYIVLGYENIKKDIYVGDKIVFSAVTSVNTAPLTDWYYAEGNDTEALLALAFEINYVDNFKFADEIDEPVY